jgi:hypothetical protein
MNPRPNPVPAETRLAEKALVLAVSTFALLTPPIIAVFDLPFVLIGVPLLHVYAFGVWLLAIITGGVIARRLMRPSATPVAPPDQAARP